MSFNTAIFYDIENLLKGYSFTQQMVTNLSLREIFNSIVDTNRISDIAIQRAYANWSDPRLSIMRWEINELGIEPVQVFGFSKEPRRNAADIQLAIDAIDLAHVRPALEVFVIVSGDGGFASLAKKLHEYGKVVIGCAYRSSTNRVFQSVCDEFVWIEDPEVNDDSQSASAIHTGAKAGFVNDPRNVRLASRVKQLNSENSEEVLNKVREVLSWYASDLSCRRDLEKEGIMLSVVQEGVRYAIPGFEPVKYGFSKFSEYLQFACRDTEFCVARPGNSSQAILFLRKFLRDGINAMPDLGPRDIDNVETYRSILAVNPPIMRLPAPAETRRIAGWICENRPADLDVGQIIESISNDSNIGISSEAAKLGILAMVSAGIFDRTPQGVPLSEQRLTLKGEITRAEDVLSVLEGVARNKIHFQLGRINEAVLKQLFE